MIEAVYDLTAAEGVEAAARDLKGYWKLWSACLLRKASLPTLAGIIFTRPDSRLHDRVRDFLDGIHAKRALIRHDARNESPPYPRGGFIAPERLLPDVLHFFFKLGRIVAVYEPANPLLNGYNLNVLFESETEVLVEIVGPGFDASDLQRGDLSPHEVFSLVLSADGNAKHVRRDKFADELAYNESKQLRLQKIERNFHTVPSSELAREIRDQLNLSTVKQQLKLLGSPLLETSSYVSISEAVVANTVTRIVSSGVLDLFRFETGVGFPLNFSTSQIEKGKRQVYWDVVSPALKFQGL